MLDITKASKHNVFKRLKYLLLFMLIYGALIATLDAKFNIMLPDNKLGTFHLLFNFCLTVMISFRINIAYNRWWEARNLWGSLINNSRNLALKLNKYIVLKNDIEIINLIAFFPDSLANHLHKDKEKNLELMKKLNLEYIDGYAPITIIQQIINKIDTYSSIGKITSDQFRSIEQHVSALTDILGACEKIANTPTPAGFNHLIKFAISFYIIIFPFGWVDNFGMYVIPILAVIIYVLMGLEITAEEIESPFNISQNTLPIDKYAEKIAKDVIMIAKI